MGVHGLWTVLKPCGRRVDIETLRGKIVAVDVSIWITQFIKAMRGSDGTLIPNAHLIGSMRRILKLLYYKIRPLFVFDGASPVLKKRIAEARRQKVDYNARVLRRAAQKLLANQLMQKRMTEDADGFDNGGKRPGFAKNFVSSSSASTSGEVNGANISVQNPPSTSSSLNADKIKANKSQCRRNHPEQDAELTAEEVIQQLPLRADGEVDVSSLVALPEKLQYEVIFLLKDRRRNREANRNAFIPLASSMEKYSSMQLSSFIRSVQHKKRLDNLESILTQSSGEGQRIASEDKVEYMLVDNTRSKKSGTGSFSQDEVFEMGTKLTNNAQSSSRKRKIGSSIGLDSKPKHDDLPKMYRARVDEGKALENAMATAASLTSWAADAVRSAVQKRKRQLPASQIETDSCETINSSKTRVSLTVESEESDDDIDSLGISFSTPIIGHTVTKKSENEKKSEPDFEPCKNILSTSVTEADQKTNSDSGKNESLGSSVNHNGFECRGFLPKYNVDDIISAPPAEEEVCLSHVLDRNDSSLSHNDETITEPDNSLKRSAAANEDADRLNSRSKLESEDVVLIKEDNWKHFEAKGSGFDVVSTKKQAEILKRDLVMEQKPVLQTTKEEFFPQTMEEKPVKQTTKEEFVSQTMKEKPCSHTEKNSGSKNVAFDLSLPEGNNLESEKMSSLCKSTSRSGTDTQFDRESGTVGFSVEDNADAISGVSDVPGQRQESISLELSPERSRHEESDQEFNWISRSESKSSEKFFPAKRDSEVRQKRVFTVKKILEQENRHLAKQRNQASRDSETVSPEMVFELQELLDCFGLPYIVSPMEAEAQCAQLEAAGVVDGVVSDDVDAFLFGARNVYKNIFQDSKFVEAYKSRDIENDLGLDRTKLINMALLLGSDYTPGIKGIGMVNASEIVRCFSHLSEFREWVNDPHQDALESSVPVQSKTNSNSDNVDEEMQNASEETEQGGIARQKQAELTEFKRSHKKLRKKWIVPDGFPSKQVIDSYLKPVVDRTSTADLDWLNPDRDALIDFCGRRLNWSVEYTDAQIKQPLRNFSERETQGTLDDLIIGYKRDQRFAAINSKRLQAAVKGLRHKKAIEKKSQTAKKGPNPSLRNDIDIGKVLVVDAAGSIVEQQRDSTN